MGVVVEPCPRWASIAHPVALSSRQATVIVSGLQAMRSAAGARVAATWRPVAWSACSAITDAIASSVVAVIDTRVEVLAVVNAGVCAHSPNADNQASRLVHIGTLGAHAPTRSIHTRRDTACVARAGRGEKSRLRH